MVCSPLEDAPRRQPTILLVDDDKTYCRLLSLILTGQGYRVVTATTVQEAEGALHHPGPRALDLVITDIRLTNTPQAREGLLLFERWTVVYPTLPFLLISGYPGITLPAVRSGVVPFLGKPFAIRTFLQRVEMLLQTAAC
jgi:DNA-binding NtrC family response regulator